jgi:hypothetical protein
MKTKIENTVIKKALQLMCFFMAITSTATFAEEGGPSLDNLKTNTKAIGEEMSRQEMMSYVFMVVGFSIVIAVAWFSTSLAKKRRLQREEFVKNHHANNAHIKHNMHDPYFRAHGHKVRK